ncbi:putative pyridoxal 5'-phosphate synthase subunit PDX2 [Cytospora mali]|uniref:glutaminase n=1 Tax=Cytospora mali TaxID=578113 RepID=A0A194VXP1_CYTMA|nr:putative pyridoxal 5'-phosphate synthase subunit PDX2 [Valsa mali]
MAVTVGVLALQGGFHEHLSLLHRSAQHIATWPTHKGKYTFEFIEVRNPRDLARCDALIVPGGESTTIALIAAQSGLLEPLREFVKTAQKPTWGTCAGLILLAEEANSTKKGGQELIGGLDVRVHRNHFGRQIESFVADVQLPFLTQSELLSESDSAVPFSGVFIRAPIVEQLLVPGPTLDSVGPGGPVGNADSKKAKVEILGVLPGRTTRVKGSAVESTTELEKGDLNDIVAVRQGNIMGTSFHPELTDDVRIHVWWLEQVLKTLPTK